MLALLALTQSPCSPSEVVPSSAIRSDLYGEIMAADGDRLMVAEASTGPDLDTVLVFERDLASAAWVEVQALPLTAAQGVSLTDLDLDGDRAIAGMGVDGAWSLLRDSVTGLWTWEAEIPNSSGTRCWVAAFGNDVAVADANVARCYRRNSQGWGLFGTVSASSQGPGVLGVELGLRFLVLELDTGINNTSRLQASTRVPGPSLLAPQFVGPPIDPSCWGVDDDRVVLKSNEVVSVYSWRALSATWGLVQLISPPPPSGGQPYSFGPPIAGGVPSSAVTLDAANGAFVLSGSAGVTTLPTDPAVFTYRLNPFNVYEFDSVLVQGPSAGAPFDNADLGWNLEVGRQHVFLASRAPSGTPPAGLLAARVLVQGDCDQNGVGDSCDLILGNAFDVNRNSLLDSCEEVGVRYCSPATANSTGQSARMAVFGRPSTALFSIDLYAEGLPNGGLGTFMASRGNQVLTNPLYTGNFCLGGAPIYRNLGGRQVITEDGRVRALINRPLIPDGTGGLLPVLPGDTWYFQYWYFDPGATPSTAFSDAIGVTFTQF
ncbi:hypothetical protein OAF73_01725 [Planctomycetota bacterium]|nr:hypothetical protein [Planctomycetota bacterium]